MKKCHTLYLDDDVEEHFVVGVVTVSVHPTRSYRSFACSRSTSGHSHRRGLLSNRLNRRRFALGRLLLSSQMLVCWLVFSSSF